MLGGTDWRRFVRDGDPSEAVIHVYRPRWRFRPTTGHSLTEMALRCSLSKLPIIASAKMGGLQMPALRGEADFQTEPPNGRVTSAIGSENVQFSASSLAQTGQKTNYRHFRRPVLAKCTVFAATDRDVQQTACRPSP